MKIESSAPPWWERLKNRAQSLGQPTVAHNVRHNDQGLTVESSYNDGTLVRNELAWAEVDEAIVFKRDCYTVDLICIAFGNENGSVEINEEMPEWNNIVKALPDYLPGCMSQESWFQKVAVPAFETNPVHIFRRRQTATRL
jgi:hypothetical protein